MERSQRHFHPDGYGHIDVTPIPICGIEHHVVNRNIDGTWIMALAAQSDQVLHQNWR